LCNFASMQSTLSNWNDTIVALATAPGLGAIAVIRLSGPEAIQIVNAVFEKKDLTKQASHTVHFGKLMDKGLVLDEVVASILQSPKILYRRRSSRNFMSWFAIYSGLHLTIDD